MVNKNEAAGYFFSFKVLIMALLVMGLNLMVLRGIMSAEEKDLSPRLMVPEGQQVNLVTPFDGEQPPMSGQAIITGSRIETKEGGLAEISAPGYSLRLGEQTTLLLHSQNPPQFELIKGRVWARAGEPVVIRGSQAVLTLNQGIGDYHYLENIHQIRSWMGTADVQLNNASSGLIRELILPLRHEIRFADSQITADYAALKYSKLKKELKMRTLDEEGDQWVRHQMNLLVNSEDREERPLSQGRYQAKKALYFFMEKAQFYKKAADQAKYAQLILDYLTGALNRQNDRTQAEEMLGQWDDIQFYLPDVKREKLIKDYLKKVYFEDRNKVGYLLKKNLTERLVMLKQDPRFFRVYLDHAGWTLESGEVKMSELIIRDWKEQWKPGWRGKYTKEWEDQKWLFHQLILAYADRVSLRLMDQADQEEKNLTDDTAVLEIAQQKLERTRALVAKARYNEAKTYLRNSYKQLNLAEHAGLSAAHELFVKEGALLSDRIAFAESHLKSLANENDEITFKDYLERQKRDKSIEERFQVILKPPAEERDQSAIGIEEVREKLNAAGIEVAPRQIKPDPDNPYLFQLNAARLTQNPRLIFDARYDDLTYALFDIQKEGRSLKGSFSVDDFINIHVNDDVVVKKTGQEIDISDLIGLPEEGARSEVVARDLAIQLVIKELNDAGLLVVSSTQVEVMDENLEKFKIKNILLNHEKAGRLELGFIYDVKTGFATHFEFKNEIKLHLPSSIKADKLADSIFQKIDQDEKEAEQSLKLINEMDTKGFILLPGDFRFTQNQFEEITFDRLSMKMLPLEFSGIYLPLQSKLKKAEHPLLNATDVLLDDYAAQLTEKWIIAELAGNGIAITAENIATPLSANKVLIKNYQKENKQISFVFDAVNQLLLKVAIQGQGGVIEVMTFDEFGLIQ